MSEFILSRFESFCPLAVLLAVLGLFCLYLVCIIAEAVSDQHDEFEE